MTLDGTQECRRLMVVARGAMTAQALSRFLSTPETATTAATFGSAEATAHHFEPTDILVDGDTARDDVPGVVSTLRTATPAARIVLLVQRDGEAERRLAAAADVDDVLVAADALPDGDGALHTTSSRSRRETAGSTHQTRLVASLTGREREVLRYLMAGIGGDPLAQRLGISPHTVRTHIQNLLGKLGANSRLEAAAIGFDAGLQPASTLAEVAP